MAFYDMTGLRGRLVPDAPIGKMGWFKCGGDAGILFKPADREDLQNFLQQNIKDVHVMGVLSNTIIRDGGWPGTVVRLGRAFADIEYLGDGVIKAGAFALDANVANFAADHGIAGFEFFSGIPGTIGGAVYMNAGCYGRETKDVLVECEAVDRDGILYTFSRDDLGMSYRHTEIPYGLIIVSATFKGEQGNPEEIHAHINDIKQKREESQPIREKTGGSTFANPSAEEIEKAGLPEGTRVWQLIDKVGGGGLHIGGAQMSEKHCNFMINTGEATAADLENLGEEIRRRVAEDAGIDLRWEIRRFGTAL